jgi:hypothetical protein
VSARPNGCEPLQPGLAGRLRRTELSHRLPVSSVQVSAERQVPDDDLGELVLSCQEGQNGGGGVLFFRELASLTSDPAGLPTASPSGVVR